MDTRNLKGKGLKLRREMYGDEAIDERMKAFGAFGKPLQDIIDAYADGDMLKPTGAAAGDEVTRHGRDDGGRRAHQRAARAMGEASSSTAAAAEQMQDILL